MSINNKFVALAVTTGIVAAGALGGLAMADSNDSTYPPVVDKIASKFNLNKDEVKKVFDEQKVERQAEHKKLLEEKLAQAVEDGKLTEDQKTKLLAKMEEMHQARDAAKDKAMENRQAKRDEFKKWAEQNGINLDEVLPAPAGEHGRKGHGPF